jgi:hypothetical protein
MALNENWVGMESSVAKCVLFSLSEVLWGSANDLEFGSSRQNVGSKRLEVNLCQRNLSLITWADTNLAEKQVSKDV